MVNTVRVLAFLALVTGCADALSEADGGDGTDTCDGGLELVADTARSSANAWGEASGNLVSIW